MITAHETDVKATRKVAFLTLATIFIMGYVNALALRTIDITTMITAQSGNIVWLGMDFTRAVMGFDGVGYYDDYWLMFFQRISLFLGFATGAGIALATKEIFQNKRLQFYYNWTLFAMPILAYPLILQYNIAPIVSIFLLGFSSGATLRFFRKLFHLEVNTAMATGSAMFVGMHFVEWIKKKDRKELFTLFLFLLAVLMFSFGSGIYQMLHDIQYPVEFLPDQYNLFSTTNWALLAFCIIPYFFYPKPNR
ncbi:MAG: DUF1275 domain-containing protein [Turicibacter sp.]|nr:DUF1275 domain-containing protein [Turicibacter sp.]